MYEIADCVYILSIYLSTKEDAILLVNLEHGRVKELKRQEDMEKILQRLKVCSVLSENPTWKKSIKDVSRPSVQRCLLRRLWRSRPPVGGGRRLDENEKSGLVGVVADSLVEWWVVGWWLGRGCLIRECEDRREKSED
ncbi:hypothetical protein L6452_34143 [Arctium lappa]|uniref:Uncharacterized protein n=1 Tax=Arctium lappa TaxID=4217 RepID=A0ACB8YGN4_ARCLA|nr:hypothetical protein L6452_34143 [Arctium lappa]